MERLRSFSQNFANARSKILLIYGILLHSETLIINHLKTVPRKLPLRELSPEKLSSGKSHLRKLCPEKLPPGKLPLQEILIRTLSLENCPLKSYPPEKYPTLVK